ncbi:N-acetyltransferase [Aurantimonas sp. A2-1-M11]|uniref:GNAT family N-acetyltransferase n=1 Tax=Aurantimonas sp. A2-1-M11 TaxID=3113712 RepID=UPI002F945F83
MRIRPEMPGDAAVIAAVTQAAFAKAAHSSGTEATIVDSLRRAGALTIALVAEANGEVVGHIAFSPITVEARNAGWFGLGPVSVVPDLQGQGIGSRLVREGLDLLRAQGARGCVVLGDPRFYERFGFRVDPRLRYAGVPPEYFMAQGFGQEVPEGTVAYHPSFDTH